MSKSSVVKSRLFAITALFFFFEVQAKIAPVTLSDLVEKSQAIVYGHAVAAGDSSQSKDTTLVTFEVSKVLKGAASLTSRQMILCNSPPPMVDYPDLSKLGGDNVIFLVERPSGCFGLTRGYKSIVPIRDNRALTQALEHQPKDQELKLFLQKVSFLVSSTRRIGR
jgi:hypothetical protein